RYVLKYRDALGHLHREPSGTTNEKEARRLLKRREGAAADGRLVSPEAERITIAALAADITAEYQANGRRSLPRLPASPAHLLPVFGARRAISVTRAEVDAYIAGRKAAQAANASINSRAGDAEAHVHPGAGGREDPSGAEDHQARGAERAARVLRAGAVRG